jgi:FkbM family methyltransferase
MLKQLLLRAIRAFGYELSPRCRRVSLEGVLSTAAANGLQIASVLDVGAAKGDFAGLAHRHFPQAEILLIEPLAEFHPTLTRLLAERPRWRLLKAAAASSSGERVLNVHPDLFGSSFLREDEGSDVNGVARTVRTETLDRAAQDAGLSGPFLIKLDTQGAEMDILAGASEVLANAALVILETSCLPFFAGGPLFHEVVAEMHARGFVVYDLFGLSHRPLDQALAQVDLVFVPESSPLRRHHAFASPEQREALTRRLRGRT